MHHFTVILKPRYLEVKDPNRVAAGKYRGKRCVKGLSFPTMYGYTCVSTMVAHKPKRKA